MEEDVAYNGGTRKRGETIVNYCSDGVVDRAQ